MTHVYLILEAIPFGDHIVRGVEATQELAEARADQLGRGATGGTEIHIFQWPIGGTEGVFAGAWWRAGGGVQKRATP